MRAKFNFLLFFGLLSTHALKAKKNSDDPNKNFTWTINGKKGNSRWMQTAVLKFQTIDFHVNADGMGGRHGGQAIPAIANHHKHILSFVFQQFLYLGDLQFSVCAWRRRNYVVFRNVSHAELSKTDATSNNEESL